MAYGGPINISREPRARRPLSRTLNNSSVNAKSVESVPFPFQFRTEERKASERTDRRRVSSIRVETRDESASLSSPANNGGARDSSRVFHRSRFVAQLSARLYYCVINCNYRLDNAMHLTNKFIAPFRGKLMYGNPARSPPQPARN